MTPDLRQNRKCSSEHPAVFSFIATADSRKNAAPPDAFTTADALLIIDGWCGKTGLGNGSHRTDM